MSASPLTWRSSSVLARRRVQVAAALACAAVLLLVAGMFVYDHARRDLIANGVRIDGVPVGGMRESAALEKVQRQLAGSLRRPVTVRSRPLTWTLGAREADLRIDARTMVARAVSASREGSIFSRTVRGLFGGSVKRDEKGRVTEIPESGSGIRPVAGRLEWECDTEVERPAQQALDGALALAERLADLGVAQSYRVF